MREVLTFVRVSPTLMVTKEFSVNEIDGLKGEVDRYVAEYNRMFGYCKLKLVGAMFGRRIRKLTGKSPREFTEETGLLVVIPHVNGGFLLWSRSVPLPER